MTSKNLRAEQVVGMRSGGTPWHMPFELDYLCPICHAKCKYCSGEIEPVFNSEEHFDESLSFSEYKYFLWCPKCDIDVPWMLCLRANTRRAVEMYTERFLDMVEEIKGEKK